MVARRLTLSAGKQLVGTVPARANEYELEMDDLPHCRRRHLRTQRGTRSLHTQRQREREREEGTIGNEDGDRDEEENENENRNELIGDMGEGVEE